MAKEILVTYLFGFVHPEDQREPGRRASATKTRIMTQLILPPQLRGSSLYGCPGTVPVKYHPTTHKYEKPLLYVEINTEQSFS